MARFAFVAVDPSGSRQRGHREGNTGAAVAQDLRNMGYTPLKITEDEQAAKDTVRTLAHPLGKKVTLDELILFSHQMYSLAKAGISVVRAVRGLAESSKGELLRNVLNDVADDLETGLDMASCLQRHPLVFSQLMISIVHVGENTGRLDQAFAQLARYLEMERETSKRIKAATRYPTFVIIAIAIAMGVLNVFVIPAFADAFAKFDAELPWQTQVLLSVSTFFEQYWWVVGGFAVAAYFGVQRYVATPQGGLQWDRWKLRLPVVGSVINRTILVRFCQTFAMVSRAGVPLNRGLNIVTSALDNRYLGAKVDTMRSAIERGISVTQAARESDMFTPVVLQMMAVGEETGTMDDLLDQAAGFYEEEVDYELKRLTDAIEPILIIAIGIMVLVLALGTFLPLWDLSGVANK